MEQEQTPKQVQPEDTETIQIEERDAKREFNNVTRCGGPPSSGSSGCLLSQCRKWSYRGDILFLPLPYVRCLLGGMFARRAPGARPARARRATFVLTIPTSAPDLPSHGEAPQVDHVALHTFPTKHVAK